MSETINREEILDQLLQINDWKHPFEFLQNNESLFERRELCDWNNWRSEVALKAIESAVDLPQFSLIDVACNDGFFSFQLSDKVAKGLGLEVRTEALRRANLVKKYYGREQFEFKQADLRVFDLENELGFESFDVCLCYGVLYHVTDPFRFLEKISKVTKHILSLSTFINTYEEPVLTLYKEDINMPGSGLDLISTRPSYQAIVRMLYGVGFDLVLRYVPYQLGAYHHQHWGHFFGVKLGSRSKEDYIEKHCVSQNYDRTKKEDQLILCLDVYENYLGGKIGRIDYLKPSIGYLTKSIAARIKRKFFS